MVPSQPSGDPATPGVSHLVRRYERQRRFWREVDVAGPAEHWPWLGELDRDGTPTYDGRPAREVAYELALGPLMPDGSLRAGCHDRRCVNPEHMQSVRIEALPSAAEAPGHAPRTGSLPFGA
jgi:hypothetical protein